jgi:hypothetical protein
MPTISQLPPVRSVTAADIIPLVQAGTASSVSIGTLLAGVQPSISVPQNSLLGRVSIGSGGPEPITLAAGLSLTGAGLSADGGDHADFPIKNTFELSDAVVISSDGVPNLLPLGALRSLFLAGDNISISSDGKISADSQSTQEQTSYMENLPVISELSPEDMVYVSRNGASSAVSVRDFTGGESVDEIPSAALTSDSDVLVVSQGEAMLVRQTFGGIWTWITSKICGYELPVVEISSDTCITTASHNRRLVICSQPLTLSAKAADLNSGFQCEVVNVSHGSVDLSGTLITSSGGTTLLSGQSMTIFSAWYSAGNLIYAALAGSSTSTAPPGQVTNLAATPSIPDSIELTWTAPPTENSLSYTVLSRPTGSELWTSVAAGLPATQIAIASLLASTSYDFIVIPNVNGVSGPPSSVVSAVTRSALNPVAAPTNITFSNATSSSITVAWSPSSGSVETYNVEYRQTGTNAWTSESQLFTSTSYTATSLNPSQSYDWQITAVGSDKSTATSPLALYSTTGPLGSVNSIVWNSVPSGPIMHGTGVLAVNVHASPSTAPVMFGMARSLTTLPSSWVDGSFVNSDLWGAYLPTPDSAGIWYVCCQGLDGSFSTFYPTGIQIT